MDPRSWWTGLPPDLAAWWRTGDLATAVAHGNVGGARATGWLRSLPPDAYEDVRSVTG